MKIKEKGHTLIVKYNEESIGEFIQKIQNQYNDTFQKHNLVIDLLEQKTTLEQDEVALFESLVEKHKTKANKSLVLVAAGLDYNQFDENLVVVPTLQEAFDLIEMDEIERDLGF